MYEYQMTSLANDHIRELRDEARRHRLARSARAAERTQRGARTRGPIRLGFGFLHRRATA